MNAPWQQKPLDEWAIVGNHPNPSGKTLARLGVTKVISFKIPAKRKKFTPTVR